MPTKKDASSRSRNENIAEMIKAGKPRDQAIAAGYQIQREARAKAKGKKR